MFRYSFALAAASALVALAAAGTASAQGMPQLHAVAGGG
jgi:hypothetical protein